MLAPWLQWWNSVMIIVAPIAAFVVRDATYNEGNLDLVVKYNLID
jgi:hypothetical protein